MNPTPEADQVRTMHCMEISGGSRAIEETLAMPGLDAWVFSQPYEGDESGGDVHYLSVCGGGIITRVIVADISGHGAVVAEFARSLRNLMHRNINSKSQTRLVRALNQQFTAFAQFRRFATALVATYLANKGQFTVCNAGHPRPLWRRAATGQWSLLDQTASEPGNLPLGIDDETPYRQFTVGLGQGDLVLFYTDALTEAMNPARQLLGEDGLLALVRGIDGDDPRHLGTSLLAGIDRHREGRPADDDVTLLALRHTACGPRPLSIGEKLDVYAKVFGMKGV